MNVNPKLMEEKMNCSKRPLLKCVRCGAIVEVLVPCSCPNGCLSCCDEPMTEVKCATTDGDEEKHVPVVTAGLNNTVKVNIGGLAHPMTDAHFILWVEVFNGSCLARKYLRPGEAPEVEFCVPYKRGLTVRAYCNVHGLYQTIVE